MSADIGEFIHDGYKSPTEDKNSVEEQIINGKPYRIFGVYDGHGGSEVSEYLNNELIKEIFKQIEKGDGSIDSLTKAIQEAFRICNGNILQQLDDILQPKYNYQGSTATIAIIHENGITFANVGDSPAMLFESDTKEILFTSSNHDCSNPDEKARLGSKIKVDGTYMYKGQQYEYLRLQNSSLFTRAFGDKALTDDKGLTCEPSITHIPREQFEGKNCILVLCTDFANEDYCTDFNTRLHIRGILSNEDVCREIMEFITPDITMSELARNYGESKTKQFCVNGKYYGDNATILAIKLD